MPPESSQQGLSEIAPHVRLARLLHHTTSQQRRRYGAANLLDEHTGFGGSQALCYTSPQSDSRNIYSKEDKLHKEYFKEDLLDQTASSNLRLMYDGV